MDPPDRIAFMTVAQSERQKRKNRNYLWIRS